MSTPYRPPIRAPQRPQAQRKGMAIASLVLGILGFCTMGLVGVGAIVGLILAIVALVRANREPAVYGGKGLAIGGIITNGLSVLMIPIVAAIAIPSLLRARVSANEAGTIGDIRSIISAEMAYASANGGFFDNLACLATPCIPNYPAEGPNFIDADLAAATKKSGYTRTFHPGPPAEVSEEARSTVSPSSLMSFAYVALPAQPGQTGNRSFCGDSDGDICVNADGSDFAVFEGKCPADCVPLN